jgi:hypothetical protein
VLNNSILPQSAAGVNSLGRKATSYSNVRNEILREYNPKNKKASGGTMTVLTLSSRSHRPSSRKRLDLTVKLRDPEHFKTLIPV